MECQLRHCTTHCCYALLIRLYNMSSLLHYYCSSRVHKHCLLKSCTKPKERQHICCGFILSLHSRQVAYTANDVKYLTKLLDGIHECLTLRLHVQMRVGWWWSFSFRASRLWLCPSKECQWLSLWLGGAWRGLEDKCSDTAIHGINSHEQSVHYVTCFLRGRVLFQKLTTGKGCGWQI